MAKQLNVNVAVSADTSQAKAKLEELERNLTKLSANSANLKIGINAADLQKASAAAAELSVHLKQATNADTGTLNFTKLNTSIKASGSTLTEYGNQLLKLGPQGQQAFSQLAQAVATSEVPVKRLSGLFGELGTVLKNTIRWQISSSMIHGFMSSVSQAFNYAQKLNESLNKIQIVTQASTEHMAQFAEQANKAAKQLNTTTTQYTNASLIYYQQGLSDKEVAARTATTIKMANASGQSAEKVSNQMTAIWNNFDNGTRSLESYADVITALGAATASSSEEIATGLQKFAAVADTVGLSYDHATAALATITATTRQSADTVGTGLRTLFARLQSLSLGEALEDGVNLTKYSKALETIGVKVLDMSGNLRSADDILADMGEKWQTLNDAQKTAVAQTVGGVRQYTTIMALMENFDEYQKNIGIAENSEGTVQRQADIYAKSWEASQKRVKASMESIYSDLIADDFFIGLNDNLSKTINLLDSFIDAIGGLSTLLPMIAGMMTKAFGPQIASSLVNLGQNIKVLFANPQGQQAERDAFLTSAAQSMAGVYGDAGRISPIQQNQLNFAQTQLNLQRQYAAASMSMTKQDQDIAKLHLDNYNRDRNAYAQQAVLAQQSRNRAGAQRSALVSDTNLGFKANLQDIMSRAMAGDKTQQDWLRQNSAKYGIMNVGTSQTPNYYLNEKQFFNNFKTELTDLGTNIKAFEAQKNVFKDWADTSEGALDRLAQKLKEAGISAQEVDNKLNGLNDEDLTGDTLEQLQQDFLDTGEINIGEQIEQFAENWGLPIERVNEYRSAIAAAAGDEAKLEQIARQIEQDEKNATDAVKNRSTAMKVAEGITSTASAMMSLASAASSANATLDTFWEGMKDGELTTQELGQGVTSLASTLMTGVMAFTTLSGVIGPVAAGLVTFAAIIIPLLVNVFDRLNETDTEKLERLKTEYEEATEYAEEAKDAYDRLVSARDTHNELLDELDSLKEGTIEFYNALLQANSAARDLISTYSLQSGSEWYYDQHGAIQFTDVGNRSMEEQAKAQMAQSVYQQEMAGLNFKVADNKNLTPEQRDDFAAHIREVMTSGTFGYDQNEDALQAINALYQENQDAFLSLIQDRSDLSWIKTKEDQQLFDQLAGVDNLSYKGIPNMLEVLEDVGEAFINSDQSIGDILNNYETQKWAESNLNLDNIVRTYAQTNGDKYDTLANQIALEMFHEQGHNSSEVAKYYDERYKALEDERDLEGLFQKELGYRASEDLLQDSEKMKSMIARAQTATKYGQDYLKILNDSQVDYLKQYSNYKEMSYSDLKAAIAENQNSDQRHEQIVGQVMSDYITEIQNTTDTMLRSMGLQTEQKGYVGSSFETIGYQGLTADELLASGKLSPKELNALSTLYSNIEKSVGEDNELQGIVARKILGLDENNNFVDNVNKDLLHSLQQVQWGSSTQSIFDLARLAQTAKTTGADMADTLQKAYETTLKANGGKSKVLETAWDTEEFKKGLKTVQKEFKKTGKISANNIEDIADSCDILSEALDNNVLSAGAVADAIELYSIGAIDSIDSISEELIMALETANELEDALQNAFNYIDSFNPDRSTGDIRDTYIKWGKDFYQQLAGGLTGDERTYQIAEFLGNKTVANNLRNFFFEKETGLADKPEARYAAHKEAYDAYDTMWQTVSKEGNFRAWWEFMLGGKGDNLYGKVQGKDGQTSVSTALASYGFSMGQNNGDVELDVQKGMTTQDYIDAIEDSTGMSHDAAGAFFMELVGSSEGIRGQLQANEFIEGYNALTSEKDKKNFLRSQASELNIEELTKAFELLGYESDETSQALKDLGDAQEELAEEQEKWAQAFSSGGNKADQQRLVKDLIEDETNGFREGGTLDLTGSKEALINQGNLTDAEANQAQIDYIKDEANGVTELTATYKDATGATREFTASLDDLEGTNVEEKLANFNKQLEELSTSTAKANQNLGKDLFAGFLQAIKELTDGSSDWAKEVKKALGFGEGQDFKIDLPITFKTEFEPGAETDKGLLHVIEDIKQMQGNGTITITLKMDEGGDLNKLKDAKDSFNEITEKQPITISFSTEDISEEELAKVKEQISALENQPAIITVKLGENTLASDIKTLLDSIPDTKNIQITYTLPDGSTITAGSQGLINSIFNPNDQTLAQSQFDASITRYSEYADIGAYQLTPGSEEYWQAYNADYNGTGYSVGSIANGVPTQVITPDMLGKGQTLSDMYEFNGSGVATLSEAGMALLAAANSQKDAAQKQTEASESNQQAETSASSVTRQGNNKVSINGSTYDLNGTDYGQQIDNLMANINAAEKIMNNGAAIGAERENAQLSIEQFTAELENIANIIQKTLTPEKSEEKKSDKADETKEVGGKLSAEHVDDSAKSIKAEASIVTAKENIEPITVPAEVEEIKVPPSIDPIEVPVEMDENTENLLGEDTNTSMTVQMVPEPSEIDDYIAEVPGKTVNLLVGANEPQAAIDTLPQSHTLDMEVHVTVGITSAFGGMTLAGGAGIIGAMGPSIQAVASGAALSDPRTQSFIEETRKHYTKGLEGCQYSEGTCRDGGPTGGTATGSTIYHSYVNGSANRYSKPGISLTAEEGPEIVWNKQEGYAYIVGGEGHPEFTVLRPGDRIFNANDTRQILNYHRPKSNTTSSVKDPREMDDTLFGSHAVGSAYGSYGPQSTYGNKGSRAARGGKGGSSKEFKPERYHLITRQIQDLTFWYDELKKARENAYGVNVLRSIDKEISATDELVKANRALLDEVDEYLTQDLAKLNELGINAEFDSAGNILNFEELEEKYKKKADEEKDENAQKAWDAITQYEETLDKMQEVRAEISDQLYDYAELRLEKIKVKAEMRIDFDDREIKFVQHFLDKIDDDIYKSAEAFTLMSKQMGLINDKIITTHQSINDIFANMVDRYGNPINVTYEQWLNMSAAEREALDINGNYGKQLEENADDILEYIESLQEYKKKGVEKLSNAFDELNEKVNTQVELFSHYSGLLSSIRDIADLQGIRLPKEFRNVITQLNNSMISVAKNSIKTQQEQYQSLAQTVDELTTKISNTTDEALKKDYQKKKEDIEKQMRDLMNSTLSTYQDALNTAKSMFDSTMEWVKEDYGATMSDIFDSTTLLQDAFDRRKTINEQYVDDYEKYYQLGKLERSIMKDLDQAAINGNKQNKNLKALLEDIHKLQQDGTELSAYDLDILAKRYEYEKALADLEDARNAKQTVRLQRDRNGNWGYVYTAADGDELADQEQAVEDKLYEYTKTATERSHELESEIMKLWTEAGEKVAQMWIDGASPEAIADVLNYYKQRAEYLTNAIGIAADDAAAVLDRWQALTNDKFNLTTDTFGETILSMLTGISTAGDISEKILNAIGNMSNATKAAIDDYNINIEMLNRLVSGNSSNFSDIANQWSRMIEDASKKVSTNAKVAMDELNKVFTEILKQASDFEKLFMDTYEPIIKRNEDFLDGLIKALAELNKVQYNTAPENNPALAGNTWSPASFDTGGFTGSWGPDGKLAFLHEQEEVFNKHDTANLLQAANILRTLDMQTGSFERGLGDFFSPNVKDNNQIFEQNVNITAEFPNATNHSEIEEAFNNLANRATQYANRKVG